MWARHRQQFRYHRRPFAKDKPYRNSVTEFSPGQRWINNAEPDLGLGTVIEIEHRTVSLLFEAAEETRVYAKQNAPLSRIKFSIGDSIKCQINGEVIVKNILEQDGLLIYEGLDTNHNPVTVPETKLDHFMQMVRPKERLLSGQIDKDIWFDLRSRTLTESNKLAHSSLRGLAGSRTSLLAHQIYIAHEVGKRYAPRVLLADEVGLGKTIEAGMILYQQLLREQAQRVLIVVPETLQHQWLVEMLRRFDLRFSLFDSERFNDAIIMDPEINPLLDSQLVLCSLDFLKDDPKQFEATRQGEWDMLVVDEAHHLQWTADKPDDPAYNCIETLARNVPGVLLLTATPEQLGKESHFARLRLLDPERFNDFSEFLAEEKAYQPIAEIIETLLSKKPLTTEQKTILDNFIQDDNLISDLKTQEQKEKVIIHLLDHQGTGRLLFRNTRASIRGFPERIIYAYPLDKPNEYSQADLAMPQPEQNSENWFEFDPRICWLENFLKTHPHDKALLITAHASTALDIAQVLRVKRGIHAAVFHEDMTILERDRAAAFFADEENGSQLLLCSEIGGEGRNFQFASHLILFDLPENPDLLEQRIGRIDRIGQGEEIFIHIPYIENSTQDILYRWYSGALAALQETCPAAPAVYQQHKDNLIKTFTNNSGIDQLIKSARQLRIEINEQLHDGRDKLLELNSIRPDIANQLVSRLANVEQQNTLEDYMSLVFDCFGVDEQVHSDKSFVLHPGNTMLEPFPGLPDEGTTITFDRDTALKYEDMQFLTWEHDMVISAMENVLLDEKGNAAMTVFQHPSVKENTLMLECLFVLDVMKDVRAYLPGTIVRTVISEDNKNYTAIVSSEIIKKTQEPVKIDIAKQIIKARQTDLEKLIKLSQKLANKQASSLTEDALKNASSILNGEAQRLITLQTVNPNVRNEEIEFFQGKLEKANEALSSPSLRLDAIRVLVSV